MWIRSELKERAKAVLSNNYLIAFLVSIVILLAGGNGGGGGNSGRGGSSNNHAILPVGNQDLIHYLGFIIPLSISIFFIIACLRIFLGYPLEVGGRRYFIKSAQYADNRNCFRFSFYGEYYTDIILTMFIKDVLTFLWFLLFIIPGIVKIYAYSMVPYILADNPNIGYRRAIELSNRMTYGHKLNIFILDLSFLGWYILGALALGIGVFFVMPYHNATRAELYIELRKNALDGHLCNYEELFTNV